MAAQRFWLPLATSMALALLGAWRIAVAQTPAPVPMPVAADHPATADTASPTGASGAPADKVALNA
ncbi:MAG TPA: hypothetical protein VGI75_13085, partial [Pirellulales bacterium]